MVKTLRYKSKEGVPYNPDDVNIRLQHFRVDDIVHMIKNKEIDIWTDDDLQRLPNLWNKDKKSLFIESLLIKLPIPLFYFDGSTKPWRVIDGLQRLHTIIEFTNDSAEKTFQLVGLEYLVKECDNKSFEGIPKYLRSRLLGAEIEAYVINPGTPPEVKYNIFKRINTGGLTLKGQEIRNALCRGEPADFTKKLSSELLFIQATNNKVKPRRMEDREYANRFIAFQILGYENHQNKMDVFLTNALLELYDFSKNEFEELKAAYCESLKRSLSVLGEYCFYRFNEDGSLKSKKPIKAVFDTMSWNLLELKDKDFNKLNSKASLFRKEYAKFMNQDEVFFKSINDTTGTKTAVKNRFERLNFFLKNFIQ